jgi:hypothetical protein
LANNQERPAVFVTTTVPEEARLGSAKTPAAKQSLMAEQESTKYTTLWGRGLLVHGEVPQDETPTLGDPRPASEPAFSAAHCPPATHDTLTR